MATVISKEDAYAHLVDTFERAMAGEEIVIAQSGAAKLRLIPILEEQPKPRRQFGSLGPISDAEAEEAARPLPPEYWGRHGDDD